MTTKEFAKILQDKLTSEYGVDLSVASNQQIYRSLALICRQMMSENHKKFQSKAIGTGSKQVYYLCMEFLMGRSLKMSLFNLGLNDVAQQALAAADINIDGIFEEEPDAGLGNGGLGRLAACFLDSLATLNLPGDGIGPEVITEGKKVLAAVGAKAGVEFIFQDHLIGGAAIDACGDPLPDETLAAAKAADAVLLASVGGPKWDSTDPDAPRPEQGLLRIRKGLGLYTNLRPVKIYDALAGASTLRPEVIRGVDMVLVRELTGGIYFGRRERFYDEEGAGADGGRGQRAYDMMEYREYEVERIARQAFEAARKRKNKVTSVDKRNVLETSRMWREIVHRVHDEEYPDVELEDLLVDNTAMQLINRPADFDVVVTENMFGDILSDEAAQITGSLGMLASASLGDGVSLFEPSAGSAPDIAGLGIANPLAQILSAAMLLTYALDMDEQAAWVETAVARVLDEGWRTRDIADANTPADKILGTAAMGDKVVAAL